MEKYSLNNWIKFLEIHGTNTFSFEKVCETFPDTSKQSLLNALYRQTVKKRIVSVYKGFYVIIPPQYAAKGIVAPTYYIDQLMRYLGKPYYIGLLNAAELVGLIIIDHIIIGRNSFYSFALKKEKKYCD